MIDFINVGQTSPTLSSWFVEQIKTYFIVLLLLFILITILELLKKYGLIHKLGRILSPYLSMIGVSDKCASITFIGMTLVLVYGSALLIEELEQGGFEDDDVTLSVTSINLFHFTIEDTFIVVIMGASLFWVLPIRFLWTVIIMRSIKLSLELSNSKLMSLIKNN